MSKFFEQVKRRALAASPEIRRLAQKAHESTGRAKRLKIGPHSDDPVEIKAWAERMAREAVEAPDW